MRIRNVTVSFDSKHNAMFGIANLLSTYPGCGWQACFGNDVPDLSWATCHHHVYVQVRCLRC